MRVNNVRGGDSMAHAHALAARNAHLKTSSAIPPLDYDLLSDALAGAGAVVALPELHGGVCGAMCAGGAPAARRWLAAWLDDEQVDAARGGIAGELDRLVDTTAGMLEDPELKFEPLLPSDDAPLAEQVEALASFCQGFLSGVGSTVSAGARRPEAADPLGEILRDFTEIGRAGLSEDEAAGRDQPDFALAQIHEYVRVSVQIVFEELGAERAAAASDVH
jgi:uncharacterized protein YgfB (UPF0149 family)